MTVIRLLCCLLLASFVHPACAGDARGLLWQVTSTEGHHAWLVGTVHAARPDFYPLPEAVEAAFAASGVLVIESDTSTLSTREIQQVTRELGMYRQDGSLRERLPHASWQSARQWSQRVGIPENRLLQMRPWLVAITLASLEMQDQGLDPQLGMERHFLRQAAHGDKRVLALETFEQQMRALAELPDDAQVRFLVETLDEADDVGESVERILSLWRDGDLDGLEALLDESYGGEEALYAAMIRNRNRAWLQRIEAAIDGGDTPFIAVGSLHLAGPDGLIRLLKDRGYAVDQISIISKSSLPAPQSGQTQFIGISSQRVPGSIPLSGCPSASS